jgi:hypothetical protein
MTTSTSVPVTVSSQASARIAKLGLQAEMNRMIDHARQNLPDITRIEVVLYDRDEPDDEAGLAIEVYCPFERFDPTARIRGKIGEWLVTQFSPEILEHLMMDYLPEDEDAR